MRHAPPLGHHLLQLLQERRARPVPKRISLRTTTQLLQGHLPRSRAQRWSQLTPRHNRVPWLPSKGRLHKPAQAPRERLHMQACPMLKVQAGVPSVPPHRAWPAMQGRHQATRISGHGICQKGHESCAGRTAKETRRDWVWNMQANGREEWTRRPYGLPSIRESRWLSKCVAETWQSKSAVKGGATSWTEARATSSKTTAGNVATSKITATSTKKDRLFRKS